MLVPFLSSRKIWPKAKFNFIFCTTFLIITYRPGLLVSSWLLTLAWTKLLTSPSASLDLIFSAWTLYWLQQEGHMRRGGQKGKQNFICGLVVKAILVVFIQNVPYPLATCSWGARTRPKECRNFSFGVWGDGLLPSWCVLPGFPLLHIADASRDEVLLGVVRFMLTW